MCSINPEVNFKVNIKEACLLNPVKFITSNNVSSVYWVHYVNQQNCLP